MLKFQHFACAGAIAGIFGSIGFISLVPAFAQQSEGRFLWVAVTSPAARLQASDSIRGQITLKTSGGKTLPLEAKTTGECSALIARYAGLLGYSQNSIGNGWEAASKFAARSGNQFSYVKNGSAERPYDGGVISISGKDVNGKPFPNYSDFAGHVGVVQKAVFRPGETTGTVTLFDQNWPSETWKTVDFVLKNGVWYGTMRSNGRSINVEGWANPARSLPTTPDTSAVPVTPTVLQPGSTTSPGPIVSGSTIKLTWSAVQNATSYAVRLKDLDQSKTQKLDDIQSNSLSFKPSKKHKYSWTVKACNKAGCSAESGKYFFKSK